MTHEVGYARVSKREQNPDAQAAGLRAAGYTRVFVDDSESSRVIDRPQAVGVPHLRPGGPSINTTSPMGRTLFGSVAVFAQLMVGHI